MNNPYANYLNQTTPNSLMNPNANGYAQPMQQYNNYQNPYAPQQTQQQPQAPQPPTDNVFKVNGIEGATAYPTTPNSTVALFDSAGDKFFLKCSDAANFSTIKTFVYQLEEVAKTPEVTEKVDYDSFVKKEDWESFKVEIDKKFSSIGRNNNTNNNSNKNDKTDDKK